LWAEASMGSPGMRDVKWIRPVRPGDRLRCIATVVEAAPSRSRPDRGHIVVRSEIFNQNGEQVAEYSGINILRRRP
ncbi:acyl dehydratase, partial [Cribrihabitans sp. XS_ASV171]